jgi:cathepsin B
VFDWISTTGVVTGGDYIDIGKGDTCAPYSLPTCQHKNLVPPTPEHPACPETEYSTPGQFASCKESAYPTSFEQDKVIGGDRAYRIQGEDNIKSDLTQYGSVAAMITVYEDFAAYKSGVYHHTTGSRLAGHAVSIIGWGTENGTPYWLVRNSWNEDWGEKGLFRIQRGSDECGIESGVCASHYFGDEFV